ncbi:MAG: GNAT family N-acetyltransferase [Chloroflexi bacterium]|nr:GNAT family N-acetyltransferase [Chloroflexota bacterium]
MAQTTSGITIRATAPADLPAFTDTLGLSFGVEILPDARARFEQLIEPTHQLIATENGRVVGTAGVLPLRMTVPGGEAAAAGITHVGVSPSHRRHGILRQLMRRQLDDLRARNEPLAILWASESAIYQRFGYGLGTLRLAIDVERGREAFIGNPEPVGQVRIVDVETALRTLPEVYERVRVRTPGAFARSPIWWKDRRLIDLERFRRGGGPMFRAILEIDGRPEGYALYRIHGGWSDDNLPNTWLDALEAVGTTPMAVREIWRFLFGVDLVTRVRANRLYVDHPLFFLLQEPRRLRSRLIDGIWLRVVDLVAALEARTYGAEDTLTLAVDDAFCPWNAGVWKLDASPDGAHVTSTTAEPDLRLSAADLGALYLGGVHAASLVHAGRIIETRPGAARRADTLFASDVPPWCPDDF